MFELASAAVVAGLGAGLVVSAPLRPGEPMVDGVDGVGDQFGEQVADFLDGQRDQWLVGGVGPVAFPGGDHGQDCVGEHDQGRVPIPGVPPADLVLVQADRAFRGLKAGLNRPAGAGHPDEGGQAGSVALSVGKIEADLSSEIVDPPSRVAAPEASVRRVPVPAGSDRGRGALVSAVQFVLSRR
jgi:hypothetical protein